jgi:RNA polymerase sigma factor (sigma-70 family)
MAEKPRFATGSTLFNFVADPANPDHQAAFERRYKPLVLLDCRERGLQPSDADDIAQVVLFKLWQEISNGVYDPSKPFRAWFRTLIKNCIVDHFRKRRPVGGGGEEVAVMEAVPAPDRVSEEFERGLERAVAAEALELLRQDVSERDYAVFVALAVDGRTGEDVAAEFGLKKGHVYVVRQRVKDALVARVRAMDPDLAAKYEGRAGDVL